MLAIPYPPQPEFTPAVGIALSIGLLIVGVLLLLWGRFLARGFLVACGGLAGAALAGGVAERLAVPEALAGLGMIIIFGILALLASRVAFAVLLAGLTGSAAVLWVLSRAVAAMSPQDRPSFQPLDDGLGAWLAETLDYLGSAFSAAAPTHGSMLLCAGGLAFLVPLVALLVFGRLGRILVTSLGGGSAVTGGLLLGLGQLRPSFLPSNWTGAALAGSVAVVISWVGLAYQYHAVLAGGKDEPPEKEPGKKGKTKVGREAEKEK